MKVARRLPLTLLAVVAAVAACGGPQPDSGQRSGTSPEFEDALADALRQQGTDDGESEPEQHERAQQFLADCLAREGFTYHPAPAPQAPHEALGLTDREFRLQYGRGISTLISERQAQAATEPEDPNEQARSAMSEAERTAYAEAQTQCERAMVIEIGIIPTGRHRLPSGSPLGDIIIDAARASRTDPRVVEVLSRWAGCMREQGFDYGSGEELEQALFTRAEPIRQAYVDLGQALVAQGRTWDELSVEEVLPPDRLDELRDLQALELAAVGAEVTCEDRGIDVRAVAAEVQSEYLRDALEER
jgi:hypothetical protein